MKFVVIVFYPEIKPEDGNPGVTASVIVHDSFSVIVKYLGEGDFIEADDNDEIRFKRTDGAIVIVKIIKP